MLNDQIKNKRIAASRKAFFVNQGFPQIVNTSGLWILWKNRWLVLSERLEEIFNERVEGGVLLAVGFYFSDRVNYR
jgi:hypothetical protein